MRGARALERVASLANDPSLTCRRAPNGLCRGAPSRRDHARFAPSPRPSPGKRPEESQRQPLELARALPLPMSYLSLQYTARGPL
eukprot:6235021-Pyramimonas_sp.AAC.1